MKNYESPKVIEAGKLYQKGLNFDEVGMELGISPLTAKTYVTMSKVGVDEAKYARVTMSGKVIMGKEGKEWAKQWDMARLPLLVLMRHQ